MPDDEFAAGIATRDTPRLVAPVVSRTVVPKYTSQAMRAKIQGDAAVQVVISAEGRVEKARIVRSLDSYYGLDEEAVKAALQWTFMPGTIDGRPVPVSVVLFLNFRLH